MSHGKMIEILVAEDCEHAYDPRLTRKEQLAIWDEQDEADYQAECAARDQARGFDDALALFIAA